MRKNMEIDREIHKGRKMEIKMEINREISTEIHRTINREINSSMSSGKQPVAFATLKPSCLLRWF